MEFLSFQSNYTDEKENGSRNEQLGNHTSSADSFYNSEWKQMEVIICLSSETTHPFQG